MRLDTDLEGKPCFWFVNSASFYCFFFPTWLPANKQMLLKAWEFFSRHYREVKLSPPAPPTHWESPDTKISWSIQQEFNAFCQSLKPNNTMFWGLDVNLLLFLRQAGVFASDFRLLLWIFVKTGSHWHVYWVNHTSNILVMRDWWIGQKAKHSLKPSSVVILHCYWRGTPQFLSFTCYEKY